MINYKTQIKINYMSYHRLEKLANWLTNRYWQKDIPELAKYIIVRHYHWEEAKAGIL
jgi:hypothetical protein